MNRRVRTHKHSSVGGKRREIAIEYSWDKRIEDMLNVIDNYIGQF